MLTLEAANELLHADVEDDQEQDVGSSTSGHDHTERKALLDWSALDVKLRSGCCKNGCLTQFDLASAKPLRNDLARLNRVQRHNFFVRNPSVKQHAQGNTSVMLRVVDDPQQRPLCVTAFMTLMGIGSKSTWERILRDAAQTDPALHLVRC